MKTTKKNPSTTRLQDCKLVGRKLLVRRCLSAEAVEDGYVQGGIYVVEERADTSPWFEILAVSQKCKYFGPEHVGCFVLLPEVSYGNTHPVGNAEIMVKESMWDDKKYRIKGQKVTEKNRLPLCVVEMEA